jgi:hypothetical protein
MRMFRNTGSILMAAVLVTVLATAGTAQTRRPILRNDAVNPLQIRSAELPPGDGRGSPTRIVIENIGSSDIVAYVIARQLNLSNGRTITNHTIVDHNGLGLKKAPTSLPPRKEVPVPQYGRGVSGIRPGVSVESVELYVAYAETADGKVFGPDAEKFKADLALQREARRNERSRLRHLHERSGAEALLVELQKE